MKEVDHNADCRNACCVADTRSRSTDSGGTGLGGVGSSGIGLPPRWVRPPHRLPRSGRRNQTVRSICCVIPTVLAVLR